MELKLDEQRPYGVFVTSFNRTFMELKHRISNTTDKRGTSFNRTFMELKLELPSFEKVKSVAF